MNFTNPLGLNYRASVGVNGGGALMSRSSYMSEIVCPLCPPGGYCSASSIDTPIWTEQQDPDFCFHLVL